MRSISRRDFIKDAAAVVAVGGFFPGALAAETDQPTVYVAHGTDVTKMLKAGIARMGGWRMFVAAGKKAAIKPNAAWASSPEQGGNTDPRLVAECVAACKAEGASEVVVPENPCSKPELAFSLSGIEQAVKKAGGRMYAANKPEHFHSVKLDEAKELKQAAVVIDVLTSPCLINIPVAKNHGSAGLTLSMKNWMGSVQDREVWHKGNLHQCIADFSTLVKPSLVIIDATRIMLTNGPRGPGRQARPNRLIMSKDPVAADAYAATLFEKHPFEIPYIKIAHEMNVGCGDLRNVNIVEIKT